jgi:hypothetical protein
MKIAMVAFRYLLSPMDIPYESLKDSRHSTGVAIFIYVYTSIHLYMNTYIRIHVYINIHDHN